tara:strand:- start:234 stop:758 length:525 start_codon:yes stop_codon:yes gene_type:complete
MSSINVTLPDNPVEIFQNSYYEDFLNDPNHPFNVALIDNDVYDFTPQSPMKLLHCSGDDNIPYENSVIAYNAFVESGATDVYLEDGGDYDHVTCAQLAIIGSKLWIDSMSEICVPESVGIIDFNDSKQKKLQGMFDLLGREIKNNDLSKQVLIYFYDDGSFEKRYPLLENQIQY